jgi:DNA repair photolyase
MKTEAVQTFFPLEPSAQAAPPRRRFHGEPVEETPRAQFRPLACNTILNENANRALPFRWTINPYRGCEFGCTYCFARYTHAYLDHADPASFESKIYVKFQAAQVLAETLKPEMVRGRPVAMGTATDPYQPAEKRFLVTRRLLEVLARCPDVDLSITTKSPLIVRDVALLQRISRNARLTVHVSLITLNSDLARIVEGRAPTPRRRLDTIRALRSAGIDVGVFVMPILPDITDARGDLRGLLRAAREAGAGFAVPGAVRLLGPAWLAFEPVLRRHFPHLLARYRALRENSGAFSPEVVSAIMDRFREAREEVGLADDSVSDECDVSRRSGTGWLFEA